MKAEILSILLCVIVSIMNACSLSVFIPMTDLWSSVGICANVSLAKHSIDTECSSSLGNDLKLHDCMQRIQS